MLSVYILLAFSPFIAYAIFKVRSATKRHHQLTEQLLTLNESIDIKLEEVLKGNHVN